MRFQPTRFRQLDGTMSACHMRGMIAENGDGSKRVQSSAEMLEELSGYVMAEPWPFCVDLAASRGMWLATVEGTRIHDWAGQYGSRLLGYNHPRMEEPAYLRRMILAANNKLANPDFLTPECLDYYRLLHHLAPRCMQGSGLEVYAVNSGAEAVENMLKYLINLHLHLRMKKGLPPAPPRIIWFERAFHGRTVLTLNICEVLDDEVATRGFRGMIANTHSVPFPSWHADLSDKQNGARAQEALAMVRALLDTYPDEVAAVIAEPMQGAGGQRVPVPGFFSALSELLHERGVFLAFDEVQTAGGTCGSIFTCDLLELAHPPQAVAVAKKFGCGAVFMREHMEDLGVLDSTWGGSLADMVRFVQEWKIVEEEGLLDQVAEKQELIRQGLLGLEREFPHIYRNTRGWGIYLGISTRTIAQKQQIVSRALQEHDTLLLGAGRQSIRLRPPLDVSRDDIERLFDVLVKISREVD